MPDSGPPSVSPSKPRVAKHKFRPSLMLSGVVAIGLILVSGRQMRARQNLVAGISGKTVGQFIPMIELLSNRIDRKSNYIRLQEQLATAKTASNPAEFTSTSYELAKFISGELGDSDYRRRDVMLDVVAVAGDSPVSSNAYWALLEPAWKKQLQSRYPAYTAALTKFATADEVAGWMTLAQLAKVLHTLGEPLLELQTLRSLRQHWPISVTLEPSLNRLLNILPDGDPERPKLEADLQAFTRHRQELLASMNWFQTVNAKAANATVDELEAMRKTAPTSNLNAFIASVDAYLTTAYAKAGRLDDARKLRIALSRYDMADAEDCVNLANQAAESMEPAAKKSTPPMQPPWILGIQLQAWRGHLITGEFDAAEKLAKIIFDGELKSLKKYAEDEKSLAKGELSKLSPAVVLVKRSDNLPAELEGVTEALFGQFQFKPAGKVPPVDIRAVADLWVSADKCVVVVSADEPRSEFAPQIAKGRDSNVWADECIELFFIPEHWFDMYYQVDINTYGTIFDARLCNNGNMTRRQYNKPDTSYNLPITSKTTRTEKGWQMRIVLPRDPLISNDGAIKFNIRRFRHVPGKKATEMTSYSWTGTPGMDHKPEQFGWLIVPK